MSKSNNPLPITGKVVLRPVEFAALFGRHYTWAYRQIKLRRIKVVTENGRILIPKSEVTRILGQAHMYGESAPSTGSLMTDSDAVNPMNNEPSTAKEFAGINPEAETPSLPPADQLRTTSQAILLEVLPGSTFHGATTNGAPWNGGTMNSSENNSTPESEILPPSERLWTTEQVADYLQVCPKTVYNLRKVGLPYVQLGGAVRFHPQGVKDYLAAHPHLSLHRLRQIARKKGKSS